MIKIKPLQVRIIWGEKDNNEEKKTNLWEQQVPQMHLQDLALDLGKLS